VAYFEGTVLLGIGCYCTDPQESCPNDNDPFRRGLQENRLIETQYRGADFLVGPAAKKKMTLWELIIYIITFAWLKDL